MRSSLTRQLSIETNDDNNNKTSTAEKYSLRRRKKRTFHSETLEWQKVTADQTKPKIKTAPLSKYRRKTANARERTRMREINSAFENLRRCVPLSISSDEQKFASEKLTKITTLRLAMKYIKILSDTLSNPSYDITYLISCKRKNCCELVNGINNNRGTEEIAGSEAVRAVAVEKLNQKQITIPDNITQDAHQTLSKSKSGVHLESDGESLHFSESCLSPIRSDAKSLCDFPLIDECMELTLFLDSRNDNMEMFKSSYSNSIAHLESPSISSDLLENDFPDQVPFDMFLT